MTIGNDRIACENFRNYLMNRCNLTYKTASNYIWVVNSLSKALKEKHIIDGSIYDIKNIHQLLDLKTQLADSRIYRAIINKCHGILTPGLRHYYDFMVANPASDHSYSRGTRVLFQRL